MEVDLNTVVMKLVAKVAQLTYENAKLEAVVDQLLSAQGTEETSE